VVLERSCARLVILATSREGLGIDGEQLVPVPPLAAPGAGCRSGDDHRRGGGAPVRGPRGRGQARFQGDRRERGGGRRGGPAPGWGGAGDRAGGGAGARDDPGRAGPPPGPALRGARGWPAGRGRTSPDAAGRDRLVLRAAHRARAGLLGRLAVFAGGCTLQAAETVCSGEGIDPGAVFELLASLVARSLVVAEESGPRAATGCWRRSASTARNASRRPARPSGGGPATPATTRASPDRSGNMPTPPATRRSGLSGSAPSRTTCSRRGRGRSTPATSTRRSRSWPASRPARSGAVIRCCFRAQRPSSCPARLSTRVTRSPSRSAQCSRRFARM
jgi:Predicted ATPase